MQRVSDRDDGADAPNSTEHGYREVRAAILNGVLEPGSVFSQVQLAARLGISRTPLREALRILQTEGLVHSEARRQVRVASLELPDLDQLYAMRISLELLGVRLTVPRLADNEIVAIREAYEEMADGIEQGEAADVREPHRRFHFGLIAYSGERLRRTASDLWDHAERYRRIYTQPGADQLAMYTLAQREHEAILLAAEERDADACGRLVVDHIARVALTVIARQDHNFQPEAIREALASVGDLA